MVRTPAHSLRILLSWQLSIQRNKALHPPSVHGAALPPIASLSKLFLPLTIGIPVTRCEAFSFEATLHEVVEHLSFLSVAALFHPFHTCVLNLPFTSLSPVVATALGSKKNQNCYLCRFICFRSAKHSTAE